MDPAGVLGSDTGEGHFVLDYHDVTILGYVAEWRVRKDKSDPDSTVHSYKVDPRVDPGALVVAEVGGRARRFLIRKLVEHTFNQHHNIERIRYVDEED